MDAGSIGIDLPDSIGADLDATTSLGYVSFDETDFTAATVTTDTPSHVVAVLNGGGAAVTLHTDVGSINVGVR